MAEVIRPEAIAQTVNRAAESAGFDLAGVVPLREEDNLPEAAAFVEWVEAGHAGEMAYMEKRTETGSLRRASARNAAPWARSVVVCALNYNTAEPYSTRLDGILPAAGGTGSSARGRAVRARRGWISRYAWGGMDYHDALLPRLKQVETALRSLAAEHRIGIETRCYVDTGPILERAYAKYAGIGWIGKNACIIHQKAGSWLFLGAILTSLDLGAGPAPHLPPPDRCGTCRRCIDACPTAALVAPGKLDARRCIAYLTIEKRGAIPEEMRAAMGGHVFGCDICQDVCPWNNKPGNAPATSLPEFQPRAGLFHPDLEWLAEMDQETYRATFRGSPLKRAKFAGLKRNVAIAMGNSGNRDFVPVLRKMAAADDAVIAEHARWALEKLGGP